MAIVLTILLQGSPSTKSHSASNITTRASAKNKSSATSSNPHHSTAPTTSQNPHSVTSTTSSSGNSPTQSLGSGTTTQDSQYWLINSSGMSALQASDPTAASWFFNGSQDWVISGYGMSIGAASPVADYESYAQFASDIVTGNIASGIKWVLYDDEAWSGTPSIEQQHPETYLKEFAQLAHQHGFKVIETPARDLMSVQGADCDQATTGASSVEAAYLACNIAADTQDADVMDIQSQGDQTDLPLYTSFTNSAAQQAHAVNPNMIVIAGLTSYRGYDSSSIVSAWQAVRATVQGFWMNISPSAPTPAQQALDSIIALEH
ncbi:MAG TPA: hypothetical protein VGS28_04090 [Candidatus Saccharimonadales bacterium]|nr:hypothetical protein [Candidatus Saccharimonadales bacterium]